MSNPKDPRTFDVRLIERNIKNRSINPKDVEKYLESLPDVSDKAVTLGAMEDQRAQAIPGDEQS